MSISTIRSASDNGKLVAVLGGNELQPDSENTHPRFDEYVFKFERGDLVARAEPGDDTLLLSSDSMESSYVVDLTNTEPWNRLIGCEILLAWVLHNHFGYIDGLQLEFARPGTAWGIQLMSEGSSLSARSIASLTQMSNLLE